MMQDLQGITAAQFKSAVQAPKAKFEIYYGGAWIDLTALGTPPKNYLKSFSLSLGGATMTPEPVAGTWSAVIDDPDGIFYPANPAGTYKDYFITGRKVRISIGGTYGGVKKYWKRLTGVMDSPKFGATIGGDIQLKGMDYSQYLADYKLKSPDNYWGTHTHISTLDPIESLGAEIYDEADALEIGAGEADTVASWGAPATITLSSLADAGGGSTYVMKAVFVPGSTPTTETFDTAGPQQWLCPAGITSVDVETWGAGAGGGGSDVSGSTSEIRRPTSDYANTGWVIYQSGGPYWPVVDDEIPDDGEPGDPTLIYAEASKTMLFGFSPFTVPAGATITELKISYRSKKYPILGICDLRSFLRIGGGNYFGAELSLASAWVTRENSFLTNPRTGVAWTVNDINGIGANALEYFGLYSGDDNQVYALCTQFYAEVFYNYVVYGGGGGGGGAYSKKTTIAVIPGQNYAVMVGAAGIGSTGDGTDGGDSYFIDALTVMAKGGSYGRNKLGGLGGLAVSGVGDTKYGGGDAGDGGGAGGGGGGSSAGTAAVGGAGVAGGAALGGAGGTPPAGGGIGGDGGDSTVAGHVPASGNGGGGGGAGTPLLSGGDGKPGKVIVSYTITGSTSASITDTNIGAITAGTRYKVTFKYKLVSGTASMVAGIYVGAVRQGEITGLTSTSWATATFYFTATDTGTAKMIFDITVPSGNCEYRIDQVSMKSVSTLGILPRYALPAACTGVYYATLNGVPIWYGVDPDGWFYDAVHNEFYFSPNSIVVAGTNNLTVYYHTAQLPVYVVADILVSPGLYATRALALAAMIYTETGPSINRVWFEAGTSALAAIRMLCERCNFRFYFNYDNVPVFIPAPVIKGGGLEDFALEQNHIASPEYYEDSAELFNSIGIEGEKISQPIGLDQTMPSNYKGSDTDPTSIAAYGERTKAISNYLFQSDAACAAMATELKADFKDPKKYFSFNTEFFAVPLEMGDTIRAQVRLSSISGSGKFWGTFLWGDGTLWGSNGIVIVHRGKIRDIKITDFGATYICELAP